LAKTNKEAKPAFPPLLPGASNSLPEHNISQVVADWQALAFYLPGVASSLAKQTYAASGG
jgi:hypothetical protein